MNEEKWIDRALIAEQKHPSWAAHVVQCECH